MKQIKPLNPGLAYAYDTDCSEYPDVIRIPMENGHVVGYARIIEQPIPRFVESYEMLMAIQRNTYGGYKPKHEKRPVAECHSAAGQKGVCAMTQANYSTGGGGRQ